MTDKNKNRQSPDQPPAPLPDALRDFIQRVTPKKDAPLTELRERFAENRRHDPTIYTPQPIGSAPGSVEYMVEMRIRLWMREKEIEAARAAAQEAALKKRAAEGKNSPPAHHDNSSKMQGNQGKPPRP